MVRLPRALPRTRACSALTHASVGTHVPPCPARAARAATLSPRYGEANNGGSACHEAGFDAWQTAYVFASYLRLLHAATLPAGETPISLFKVEPPLTLAAEHVGRLALPRRDFPYLSLRGDDPLEDQSNVFVITGTVPLAPQPAAGGQDAQESEVPADGEASVAAVAAAQTPVPMPRSPQEASRAAFGLGLGRWDAFWRPTGEFVLALQDRSKLEVRLPSRARCCAREHLRLPR